MERVPYTFTEETIDNFKKDLTQQLSLSKSHGSDGAYDLRAIENVSMLPGDRTLVKTGLRLAIPEGYAGLILPRSSLALNDSITVLNAPGLIDAGYRGEIGVVLYYAPRFVDVTREHWTIVNVADANFEINPGDRIAQLLFIKLTDIVPIFAERVGFEYLMNTERGEGGFGSTGR